MNVSEVTITSWHIPASVIAKWPPTNLENPERRHGLVPLSVICMVVSFGFVVTRVYARLTGRAGGFALDDVLILAAWVIITALSVGTIWGTLHAGFDLHIWDAVLIGRTAGLTVWLQEMAFLLGTGLVKISVLVFYRRLFFTNEPTKRRIFIDSAIGFVALYTMATVVFLFLSCTPMTAFWNSLDPEYSRKYYCARRNAYDPLKGAVSVISDAYTLILPQYLIFKLKIPCDSRRRLTALFGCGWLTTIAGIVRTYYLSRLFYDPLRDLTWIAYNTAVCAMLEAHLAIVCASFPAVITVTQLRKSSSTSKPSTAANPSNSRSEKQDENFWQSPEW